MKNSAHISQVRHRRHITLRPDESVVVRCRDDKKKHHGRRITVTLRPGDRVLVRCRHHHS